MDTNLAKLEAEIDFEDAAEAAGFGRDDWEHLTVHEAVDFEYIKWQVVDAFIMRGYKDSLIKGCLLANDGGTGKTVTAFLLYWMFYLHCRQRLDDGYATDDCFPTLMLVPANIIDQVYREHVKFMTGKTKIYVIYGSSRDYQRDPARAAVTLDYDDYENHMEEWMSPEGRSDPELAGANWHEMSGRSIYCQDTDVSPFPQTASILLLLTTTTFVKRFLSHEYLNRNDNNNIQPDTCCPIGEGLPSSDWVDADGRRKRDRAIVQGGSTHGKKPRLLAKAKGKQPIGSTAPDDTTPDDPDPRTTESTGEHDDESLEQAAQTSKTKGAYVRYELKMTRLTDFRFSRVIVDEAQCLRNPTSAISRAVSLIPKDFIHLLSATPIMDTKEDMRGHAKQFFDNANLEIDIDDETPFLLDDYDPLACRHAARDNGPPHTTPSFWREARTNDIDPMTEFYTLEQLKFWYLHPRITRHLGSSDTAVSDKIFKELTRLFCTRRTLHTKLELPDRSLCYPGQGMRPTSIVTEEVGFRDDHAKTLTMVVDTFGRRVLCVNENPDIPEYLESAEPGTVQNRLAYAVTRGLKLASFDMRALHMIAKTDRIGNLEPRVINRVLQDRRLPSSTHAGRDNSRQHQQGTAPGDPVLGVKHTNHLIDQDPDGGLTYSWVLTMPPCAPPASSRADMMHFALYYSPVMTRVVHHVCANLKENHRTLVVVDNSYCQQQIHAVLTKMGIHVQSIRASDNPQRRAQTIHEFNDRSSNLSVLVCDANVTATGSNMHHACSRGIIAQYTHDVATMRQAIFRLSRLGQPHEVSWVIIRHNSSYSDIQEHSICVKFVEIARNQGMVPRFVRGLRLQRMVTYEYLRNLLAQPFNRYAWVLSPPSSVAEYNAQPMRDLGSFCTQITHFLLGTPLQFQDDVEFMADLDDYLPSIVDSWKKKLFTLSQATWRDQHNQLRQRILVARETMSAPDSKSTLRQPRRSTRMEEDDINSCAQDFMAIGRLELDNHADVHKKLQHIAKGRHMDSIIEDGLLPNQAPSIPMGWGLGALEKAARPPTQPDPLTPASTQHEPETWKT
ncbi:hypothetical protein CHU98_g9667 [Xylaria longipes]|nr:hypothetical protein CHU98_g9667 [Xylaria longipes]